MGMVVSISNKRSFLSMRVLLLRHILGGGAYPHGGVRPFHQKSTCHAQLTLEPYVVQTWSRNTPESGPNETFVLHLVDGGRVAGNKILSLPPYLPSHDLCEGLSHFSFRRPQQSNKGITLFQCQ